MKDELRVQCMNYLENRNIIKETYKLENAYMISVAASIASGKKMILTKEKLKEAQALVDSKTGIFSSFRGNVKLAVVAMLATSDNAELFMSRITDIYNKAKAEWSGSEFLVAASAVLATMLPDEKIDDAIARGKRLYKLMRKEHPMLTSSEDAVYACLLGMSEKSDEDIIAETEKCYSLIKKSINPSDNALQTLSHVITISNGNCEAKCDRLADIYNKLRAKKRKYSKYYEISVLGALATSTDKDEDELVSDMLEIDAFLATQKGYGVLSVDKKTRLMHAGMLLMNVYADRKTVENTNLTIVNDTVGLLASQHAAMCACIASCCVSSTVAATSGR